MTRARKEALDLDYLTDPGLQIVKFRLAPPH